MRVIVRLSLAVPLVLACIAGELAAGETTVYTVDQLRNALNAAAPGDRIYVAPGNYTTRLWANGIHGTADNLIEVVALNPNDRPVFNYAGDSNFTITSSSYVLVDGIIGEGSTGNNLEFPNSHHMIMKNCLSRDILGTGNLDGTKFAGTSNMLLYNNRVENWGNSGSAVDIMNNHNSLFMRNYITFPAGNPYNANGFQPKSDGAYELGFYKNTMVDFGARGQQFGGSGGATVSEGHDMVAMGSVFVGGEAAVAYVSCTDSEFSYNTVVNPNNWVMRILNENSSVPPPSYNTFRRNIVKYGNINVQNIGSNTLPGTFTYRENFWYKWTNPASSVPTLPGAGEIDPAPDSGTDPQLDGDYRPRLPGAMEYGAHAPAAEAEFAAYQSWFQWAWDQAEVFDPDAAPGGPYHVYVGGALDLDAGGSYAGTGSYGDYTIDAYEWDLDRDGEFDDASGETPQMSYDDLTTGLGLAAGEHTIELRITVPTEYDPIVEWGSAQLEIHTHPLLMGDTNADGAVDGGDYTIWADHYQDSPVPAYEDGGWTVGNFNDDDIVDGGDYTLWSDNYTGGGVHVPEPATLALLALGGLGVTRRRGR